MGAVGQGLGTGSAGGGGFSLSSLSAFVLDLDPHTIGGSDGDAIASITDGSGNGNTASQSTAANKPTLKTAGNGVNSRSIARFDGSNDFLSVARNAGLEPSSLTIYAVIRASSNPGAFTYILSKKLTAGSSASYSMGVNGIASLRGLFNTAGSGEKSSSTVSGATVWNNAAHMVCLKYDGSNIHLYLDGNELGITAVAATGSLNYDTNNVIIGSYDASPSLSCAFDLARLLIYGAAHTDAQRWNVQGFLGNLYAIP